MLQKFHDGNDNGVILWSDLAVNYFNLINFPHRRLSFTKDRLYMMRMAAFFRNKSMLKGLFNEKFRQFFDSGLTQFWCKAYLDDRHIKSFQNPPPILHIENIIGILQICALIYLVSLIVFVLEMISVRYPRIRYIIDYFTY